MEHHFNIEIAKRLDVPSAIFIHHIAFWILKNEANKKNFRNGSYWTYNSTAAFTKLFPYYSQSQIKRIINKLEDQNIIISEVLNTKGYDRTKWYRIIDPFIVQIYSMHCTISSNGLDDIVQPIPDSKPSSKPNSNLWFLEYLNKTLKRKFRSCNESKLRERLKKFSSEEIKQAILSASKSRYHIDESFRYLTPEYFTRNDQIIDKWLNAPKPKTEQAQKTFIQDMDNSK